MLICGQENLQVYHTHLLPLPGNLSYLTYVYSNSGLVDVILFATLQCHSDTLVVNTTITGSKETSHAWSNVWQECNEI